MKSLSLSALALCAALVIPACAPPPAFGPRIQERELRIGPPAVAGQDGPIGVTALDTPSQPWTGAPGIVRTTAEIMAVAARQPRRALDLNRPRFKKAKPDRSNLPQNPDALPDRLAPRLDREAAPAVAQTVAAPTVDVARLADTGMLPPDTMGDVGPTQYLVTLNGRFRTVAKTTGLADGIIDADPDVFFSTVTAGAGTSDPRVRYDRRTQRWIVVMITVAVPNRYLVAVGNTSSTAGTITGATPWTFFQWSNTRTLGGGGVDACLGDYPTLGVDEDALYVGANQFCGGALAFDSTSLYVVRKAPLLTGTLNVAQFDAVLPTATSSGIYTPQGVDNVDSNTDLGYFIGVDNATFGTLVLRRVSSPAGTPSLSGNVVVAVPPTAFPGTVPQQGGAPALDGLDDRLLQAVIRNGRLWTNHQIRVNATGAAGGDRIGVRWYELASLANSPSLVQSGTVFDNAPSNPFFYWMGAIMPNGQGHVALGMSRSGAASVVNTAVTGRLASDPAGTMDAPVVYSPNASFTYAVQPGNVTQRWGDYSFTSVDPDDDMTFWTLQQYVDASNSYAVRLTRLLAPPPAAPVSVSPASVSPGQNGVIVTVTGSATGGRGFFDPGPGFARRLGASFGSGVTVTSAVVTSPSILTLTINTAADAAGARTLTVVNPDGQTATLAAALTVGTVANQPPVFGLVPANRTLFDAGSGATTGALRFQVGDPEGAAVTVTASSSNPAVIPSANIQLGGTGIERALAITSAGAFGSSTITLTASDGASTTTTSFVVTVAQSTVPTPPQNLTATVIRNTLVFAWQAPASAVTEPVIGYRLEAGLTPGGLLGALALGDTLGYTLSAPSGVFYLRVRAVTVAGTSAPSNEVRVAAGDAEAPLPPQALLATVQGTLVTVQWTENPLGPVIAGYQIQAGSAAGLTDIGAAPLDATVRSFTVDAPPGTYFLRVLAVNAAGASAPSNEAAITPGPGTCTVPAAPTGFAAAVQPGVLSVRWDAAASGAIPVTYQLQAGTASGASNIGAVNLGGGTTSAAGPVPPGPYFLRVVAANACGASAPSTEVAATVP